MIFAGCAVPFIWNPSLKRTSEDFCLRIWFLKYWFSHRFDFMVQLVCCWVHDLCYLYFSKKFLEERFSELAWKHWKRPTLASICTVFRWRFLSQGWSTFDVVNSNLLWWPFGFQIEKNPSPKFWKLVPVWICFVDWEIISIYSFKFRKPGMNSVKPAAV